jgi:hypothetical protein
MATKAEHAHDQRSAEIAAGLGMDGSLRLLMEARDAGLSQSLGLALRTQETGIKGDGNVFGHDPTIFVGGHDKRHNKTYTKVTKTAYLAYKAQRGPRGGGGMQGVGPLQLTYYTFQDEADRLGGCWVAAVNYRVGFRDLAHLIRMTGSERKALATYNGGASNPNFDYAASVLKHKAFWHRKLK